MPTHCVRDKSIAGSSRVLAIAVALSPPMKATQNRQIEIGSGIVSP